MTRTFFAALVGASALGLASANAMMVEGSDIPHIVSEKAHTLAVSPADIGTISVLNDWDGDGHTQGYTAWVNLKSGGSVVFNLDSNGAVEQVYTRGPAHVDGVKRF